MRKNVASQVIAAQLNSKTDGSAVTSGTTTVYVLGDGGTQSSGGGTVAHEGNGCWSYVPTQAETNYSHVAFTFVNSAAISQTLQVYPVSYDPGDANTLGLSYLTDLIFDTTDIKGRLPASLSSGRMDCHVNAMAADIIADVTLASSAITEIQSGLATASDLATVANYIDTEVAAIKAKTDNLPASPAAVGDIPSAASIASAVWSTVIEGSYTVLQSIRLLMSAILGKLSGGGTTTNTFRDTGDSKNRIVATVDSNGNRTAVTLDPS